MFNCKCRIERLKPYKIENFNIGSELGINQRIVVHPKFLLTGFLDF